MAPGFAAGVAGTQGMRRSLAVLLTLGLALVGGFALPRLARGDVGFQGPSHAPENTPTADKPQSKLWVVGGTWFGSLYNSIAGRYEIYRLSSANSWVSTGALVDAREG